MIVDWLGSIMLAVHKNLSGKSMSIAIIAKLHVAAGKEAEFEKHMLALAAAVRANEPGNRLYTLCKDQDGNYLMLELYDSAEDITAHGQSEHFKAAGKGFVGLMAGAPEIQRLEVIG
jgi:quinol monooxygenase YgiN